MRSRSARSPAATCWRAQRAPGGTWRPTHAESITASVSTRRGTRQTTPTEGNCLLYTSPSPRD
eukprot:652101-Alexandrium_andersonii.AAC.1